MLPIGPPSIVVSCIAAALGLAAPSASAQILTPTQPIYSCEDADGRVISSDRPIPSCARRTMRELNNDGTVRRVIPPPLTKDQEREQARLERLRQDEEWARKVQQSRDRNLLLTFEDEHALESMRRRGLADIDHEIRLATHRILTIDKELKAAQQAAETWKSERPGRPMPFAYQQRITDAANSILAEDALITDRKAERERFNSRFDADAKRLRELLGRPAAVERAAARAPRG